MKKLASYFGVSLSAAYKWSAETVRRKTVIMESGAEPEVIKLIGEISQLCYIFDCKSINGVDLTSHAAISVTASSAHFYVQHGNSEPQTEFINLDQSTAVTELQKVKSTLESFIY